MKAVIVVLLPLLACFGYYTLERLSQPSAIMSIAAILAGPVALLGLMGVRISWRDRSRRGWLLIAAAGACLAPALFLVGIWL